MIKEKNTVVSVFSGAGGFDWGFHQAGFKTLLACEKLPQPAKTLANNLELETMFTPATPIANGSGIMVQGDIRNVDFSQFGKQPDVLIGGPPCQDFSMAINKRDEERPGLNGVRGKLYVEFVRALMFLQPKLFVFENVPGLISANNGTAYQIIKSDLENLEEKRRGSIKTQDIENFPMNEIEGYDLLFSSIVNAPNLGISQTRRRLIIIGLRKDLTQKLNTSHTIEKLSAQIHDSLNGNGSLLPRYPLTTLEIFEGKTLADLDEKYKQIMFAYEDLADSFLNSPPNEVAVKWRQDIWNNLTLDIKKDYEFVNQIKNFSNIEFAQAMKEHAEILDSLGWLGKPVSSINLSDKTNRNPRLSNRVMQRMRSIPPGQNYALADGTEWQVKGHNISFIYRRSDPLKPAWTVMAYGGGGTSGYHYDRNESQLTLRERARIQTFTDDFSFSGPHIRAQIGEAVPPFMGQRIAETIKPILEMLNEGFT